MKFMLTVFSLWLFGWAVEADAQTCSIQGQIFDHLSRESITGALVSIRSHNHDTAVVSDINGKFVLTYLPGQEDTLHIQMIGYKSIRLPISCDPKSKIKLTLFLHNVPVELEEIRITSEPELLTEAISQVDIQLRNTNTSQDILRMVPGLFIAQHAGGGKAEQIFLRGFDIDHGTDIAITADGIPVNMVSHAHGQGYADLHFLIPETVDRVHFGKGPYHTHQGNLATAGFVGFNTLHALAENTLSFQAGQFDTYRGLGMINLLKPARSHLERNAYLAGEYFKTNGYFESPQDFNRYSFFGKFNAALSRSSYLMASVSTFGSTWDASGQIPVRAIESGQIGYYGAIDDTEGGATSRSNVNLRLTTRTGERSLLKNQIYYTRYAFELFSNFTFFLNDPLHGDQIKQRERRQLLGYSGSLALEHTFFKKPGRTEFGIQTRYDISLDNELSHTAGKTSLLDRLAFGDVMEANIGAFLHETIRLSQRLTLNGGLRFDHFNFQYKDFLQNGLKRTAADNIVSPKINAYFQINDEVQLFSNFGFGFHSNDARVVVAQQTQQTLPRATGGDLGLAWKPASKLILGVSLWHLHLDQEFVYVGDEAVVEPSGQTRRRGIEFSGRCELAEGLFIDADFNYTIARAIDEPEGSDYIPLSPRFSSIGGVTWKPGKSWSASLRYRTLGDRAANEDFSLVAEGYTIVDAMVTYRVKNYEFGIQVDNLLNERWREAQFETESRLQHEQEPVTEIHFTPGTPLHFRVHVAYKF
jgi:outer membrane cobalamin receptor